MSSRAILVRTAWANPRAQPGHTFPRPKARGVAERLCPECGTGKAPSCPNVPPKYLPASCATAREVCHGPKRFQTPEEGCANSSTPRRHSSESYTVRVNLPNPDRAMLRQLERLLRTGELRVGMEDLVDDFSHWLDGLRLEHRVERRHSGWMLRLVKWMGPDPQGVPDPNSCPLCGGRVEELIEDYKDLGESRLVNCPKCGSSMLLRKEEDY